MSHEVPLCSITGCPNGDRSTVRSTVYYFLPKDSAKAAKWLDVLKTHIINGTSTTSQMLICGKHFNSNDYEPTSKKLKFDSIPTIFPQSNTSTFENENVEPHSKKLEVTINQTVSELKYNSLIPSSSESLTQKEQESNGKCSLEQESTDLSDDELDEDVGAPSDGCEISNYNNKIRNLKNLKFRVMEEYKELQKEEQNVTVQLIELRKEVERKKAVKANLPDKEEEILKKCFSPAQIRHIKGNRRSRWSLDDLAVAYTISSLSSRDFYTHLRKNLKYPLPAVSNIARCYKSKYRAKNTEHGVKIEK